jgi:hypothetical protein
MDSAEKGPLVSSEVEKRVSAPNRFLDFARNERSTWNA